MPFNVNLFSEMVNNIVRSKYSFVENNKIEYFLTIYSDFPKSIFKESKSEYLVRK